MPRDADTSRELAHDAADASTTPPRRAPPDPAGALERDVRGRGATGPLLRRAGLALTILIGPAAALLAALGLGMGPLETSAVLILISGWLGPKLMRLNAR